MKIRHVPKYSGLWFGLWTLGAALSALSTGLAGLASYWLCQLGLLAVAVGLCVFLAGLLAARNQRDGAHKNEAK